MNSSSATPFTTCQTAQQIINDECMRPRPSNSEDPRQTVREATHCQAQLTAALSQEGRPPSKEENTTSKALIATTVPIHRGLILNCHSKGGREGKGGIKTSTPVLITFGPYTVHPIY